MHKVGSYNLSQWQLFINLRPNVMVLDQAGQVHLIRAAETLEYLPAAEAGAATLDVGAGAWPRPRMNGIGGFAPTAA